MSEYLSGVAILMLMLSPLFIPIAVTIIDAVRRWSSLAAHSSRTHRRRSSDDLPPKPAATARAATDPVSIGYLAWPVSEPS
jgi:hypothetical protein